MQRRRLGNTGPEVSAIGLGQGGRLRSIVCDSDGKTTTDRIKAIRSAVADGDDAGIAELAEDANVVRSPVPSSNDGDSRGLRLDVDHRIPLF